MRVLGIDCGTEYTGYGIVDLLADGRNSDGRNNDGRDNDRLVCIVCGAIQVSPRDPMPTRLSLISIGLQELISRHCPDRVAIEDVFYAANVKSALKLGQVRGVAMLAAASAGLEVAEYSPLSIKSAVVGYGRAEKHQVQQMVMRLLNLDQVPEPADAADALAIAICHLHTAATRERQSPANGEGNRDLGRDSKYAPCPPERSSPSRLRGEPRIRKTPTP
jgi:crossover junction endodeoxyribonuclease RuvC